MPGPPTKPSTRKATLSASGPKVSRMKSARAHISKWSSAVMLAENSLASPVSSWARFMASATSGMTLLGRREHLVALGLVVLDEVAAEPEGVGGLGEGLRAQAELGLDDGAGDVAAVLHRAAEDAPHLGDVGGRAVEQLQGARRHVEVDHLGVARCRPCPGCCRWSASGRTPASCGRRSCCDRTGPADRRCACPPVASSNGRPAHRRPW
jgi:hypothetical protein